MKRIARPVTALFLGALMVAGLSACSELPDIITSAFPELTASAAPQPTETVTEDPGPQPTQTVTESPEPVPSATDDGGLIEDIAAGIEPWMWWVIGLAALAILTLLIVWGRARAVRSAWDRRLRHARAELSWFEDSLVPQILAKPTAAEAAALWEAATPRVLETDSALHALSEDFPSKARGASAARGLQALRVLAAAVAEETSTQAGTDADALRARRAQLDAARHAVRTWIARS